MSLDTVSVMKESDPISWRCAQSDWESEEESNGRIVSFDNGSSYYFASEVDNLVL